MVGLLAENAERTCHLLGQASIGIHGHGVACEIAKMKGDGNHGSGRKIGTVIVGAAGIRLVRQAAAGEAKVLNCGGADGSPVVPGRDNNSWAVGVKHAALSPFDQEDMAGLRGGGWLVRWRDMFCGEN
jgi:hypothetical protein